MAIRCLKSVLAAGVIGAALMAGAPTVAFAQAQTPYWRTLNTPATGDYVVPSFTFADGQTLQNINLHYTTLGTPKRDASGQITNAVLMLHGSSGDASQTLSNSYANGLYGPGQPLDANEYFIILPDSFGNGGSTKPSDGLRGAFPRYGYEDQVELQHKLVTEHFGIQKLRLLMGMSMGGMHAWMWASKYPDAMQAVVPMSALPTKITGRNLLWRRVLSSATRTDPAWQNGNYETNPPGFITAMNMFDLLVQSPVSFEQRLRTIPETDAYVAENIAETIEEDDANNVTWRFESSFDYDPQPADLQRIKAPLLAILFADDELNPLEIPVIDEAISHVPNGRAYIVPAAPGHFGHRGQVRAVAFADQVAAFMAQTAR